jgi:hypothetical protein
MPIASPAVHAIVNDVKFANSAAVSAGTTASGSTLGSSCDTGATSTPRAPTITLAIRVFAIESRLGERPTSIAEVSCSNAARVSSPKRVQR